MERSQIDPDLDGKGQNSIDMWACLCHFSALLGLIWWVPLSTIWIPFGHLLGPLAVWLLKKNLSPVVDEAGRESLNFQLTLTAYGIACALAFMGGISKFLVMALVAFDGFWVVQAGMTASKGKSFRYPLVFWRIL